MRSDGFISLAAILAILCISSISVYTLNSVQRSAKTSGYLLGDVEVRSFILDGIDTALMAPEAKWKETFRVSRTQKIDSNHNLERSYAVTWMEEAGKFNVNWIIDGEYPGPLWQFAEELLALTVPKNERDKIINFLLGRDGVAVSSIDEVLFVSGIASGQAEAIYRIFSAMPSNSRLDLGSSPPVLLNLALGLDSHLGLGGEDMGPALAGMRSLNEIVSLDNFDRRIEGIVIGRVNIEIMCVTPEFATTFGEICEPVAEPQLTIDQ